jgi:hypothetical protein
MKRLIFALAALMVFTVNLNAQERQGRQGRQFNKEEMVQRRTERMTKEFGLNDAQKAQLQKLLTDYYGKEGFRMNPRRGNNDKADKSFKHERPSKEQMQKMREQMKENNEKFKAELKKIFNDEQFAKYQEWQKQRMQRSGNRMRGNR